MRLDLKRHAPIIADVDDTGIFTRRDYDTRAGRRQAFEVNAGRFIRAMLRPHHAKNTELGHIGIAAHQYFDLFVFVGSQSVLCNDVGCDSCHIVKKTDAK